MSESTWQFDLNEPGMTPFHRAGLLGLAASLKTRQLRDKFRHDIEGNRMRLQGLDTGTEAIHAFLRALYPIEKGGLIAFPLYRQLVDAHRAAIQSILFNTFLQHPQSRDAGKDIQVNVGVSEGDRGYKFKPLKDFEHRSERTAARIADAKDRNHSIPIAGWAMPGAVVKHIAYTKQTTWEDTPERYLLLMCAPLGCLWYAARAYLMNGDWDPKTQTVVVALQPTDLAEQADALYDFYDSTTNENPRLNLVAGVSDATLQAAVTLGLSEAEYNLSSGFYVMRFGKVGWSSQQKTRTGIMTVQLPPRFAAKTYGDILAYLPNHPYTTSTGYQDEQVMPMKERIAQNVLEQKPWYLGISEFMAGKRGKFMRQKLWKEGMRALVEKPHLWDDEVKREFVALMYEAIYNRYGRASAKAKVAGSSLQRALSREYERMVLEFSHCRTRDMLRETLMRFVAQTFPRFKDGTSQENPERDVLFRLVFQNEDWKEVRDLCLLAIATYKGRHANEVATGLDETSDAVGDDTENAENH